MKKLISIGSIVVVLMIGLIITLNSTKNATYAQTDVNNCVAPLVSLQTGTDAECTSGNVHQWPVGLNSDDCHGWTSVDTNGNVHENSANNITCNADGSFSFVQFAETLNCEEIVNPGTLKTYPADTCEPDVPPGLYTKATNLACCTNPDSPECIEGVPSVSVDPNAGIYLNGQLCEQQTSPTATPLPTNTPTTAKFGTTVTFTVYIDDACTQSPPANNVVPLDRTKECNETPDASISDLVCFKDKIEYTNHPNTNDCSGEPFSNTIPVGVCEFFPGPFPSWKLIEAESYDCLSFFSVEELSIELTGAYTMTAHISPTYTSEPITYRWLISNTEGILLFDSASTVSNRADPDFQLSAGDSVLAILGLAQGDYAVNASASNSSSEGSGSTSSNIDIVSDGQGQLSLKQNLVYLPLIAK